MKIWILVPKWLMLVNLFFQSKEIVRCAIVSGLFTLVDKSDGNLPKALHCNKLWMFVHPVVKHNKVGSMVDSLDLWLDVLRILQMKTKWDYFFVFDWKPEQNPNGKMVLYSANFWRKLSYNKLFNRFKAFKSNRLLNLNDRWPQWMFFHQNFVERY